ARTSLLRCESSLRGGVFVGALVLGAVLLSLPGVGCSRHSGGVVQETDEYSYDDIMAQAGEEELASEAERER
ncbi:MAG: hypothetical protein ACF788_02885, partial [Novipirellula sp. JB048]